MTKGRAALPWREVAEQKAFFMTLVGRRPMINPSKKIFRRVPRTIPGNVFDEVEGPAVFFLVGP
jgi:hypothetical protein